MNAASDKALVRALQLVDALSCAGAKPVEFSHVHVLAYLAEALAPVWGLDASSSDVLKRGGSPFFPSLQEALDALVWKGVLTIESFTHVQDEEGRWHSVASCHIQADLGAPALEESDKYLEERDQSELYLEIALALLRSDDIEGVLLSDASYSDPTVSLHKLIDLSGSTAFSTARIAEKFGTLDPQRPVGRAEKVSLYVSHLGRISRNGS